MSNSSMETQLRQQTEEFLDQASAQLQDLTSMLERLEEYRRDLADFFCEDAATFKLESALEVSGANTRDVTLPGQLTDSLKIAMTG